MTLPDDQDAPSPSSQCSAESSVSLPVAVELRLPERRSRTRHGATLTAAVPVPKTAVNEDDLPTRREDEVGATWQVAGVKAIPVSQ